MMRTARVLGLVAGGLWLSVGLLTLLVTSTRNPACVQCLGRAWAGVVVGLVVLTATALMRIRPLLSGVALLTAGAVGVVVVLAFLAGNLLLTLVPGLLSIAAGVFILAAQART